VADETEKGKNEMTAQGAGQMVLEKPDFNQRPSWFICSAFL
jgi:hypothetical protein